MSDTLEIVILGTDKASPVFKDIGDTLGKSFKIGTGIAIGGLTALTTALGLSIKEAIDAEEIQAELGAVLKSTGGIAGLTADEVNGLATKLSKVTKFSDDTIVSAQSMLLTFTKIGKNIFPQATEATLNLAQKFGSVEQASIQIGKALNDPIAGVTALRRVGVSLTEQQEEMIKQFMAVGDIASAQKVILGELETEFGGLARAAGDTLGGKLAILKNKLFEVSEGVGGIFIPILTDAADFLLETIIPTVERFAARLGWAFDLGRAEGIFELKAILSELGLNALAPLVDIADKAVTTFQRLSEVFKQGGLSGVFDQLKIELIKAAPGVLDAVKNFVNTNIITPLWDELKDSENWNQVGEFIKTNLITPMWNELKDSNNWVEAGKFALVLTKELLGKQWNASEWIWANFTSRMWNELVSRDNWIEASDFARRLVGDILGAVWNASQWARTNLVLPLWNGLMSRENWVEAGNFARELMGSLLGSVWDVSQWVRDKIIDPIIREIRNQIPNIPGVDLLGINTSSGGGGGGLAAIQRQVANQINIPPGQMPAYTGRFNFNPNYRPPMRDSGGRGLPGHTYGIGVPELFIPDRPGTFAPLSEGDRLAQTIDDLYDMMGRLVTALERPNGGLRPALQPAPNYNLTIHSNSSDERIRSDYESMRVWAGA